MRRDESSPRVPDSEHSQVKILTSILKHLEVFQGVKKERLIEKSESEKS